MARITSGQAARCADMDYKYEAHRRNDIVGSLWRWIVTFGVVVPGITLPIHAYAKHTDSILQHTSWIQNCSPNSVSVVDEGLIVYVFDLGAASGAVIGCLNIQGNPDLDDGEFVIFPSPIDSVFDMETEEESPMPEALVRSGNKLLVAAGTESDHGVTAVQRMSGHTFIVTTSYSTHLRNFLVSGSSGEVRYLINGDLKIENGKIIASMVKSYFKGGGAFWFDALIDLDGNILDIITKITNRWGRCISLHEFSQKTHLDLSRVTRHRVCFER